MTTTLPLQRGGASPGEEVIAYVGLGANLGDPAATLALALSALETLESTTLLKRSSLYETAPIDSSGPPYVNAVAEVRTGLQPFDFLKRLRIVERVHGRRRPYRNAPRTLDLDLLLYGDLTLDTPELMLPHPRMHQRAFVLVPLLEIAPSVRVPGIGAAMALLPSVAGQGIRKIPG